MSAESKYVQLIWKDTVTGELKQPLLAAPITIGREIDQMPEEVGGQSVSRLELNHQQISRFHALITVVNQLLSATLEDIVARGVDAFANIGVCS